MEFLNQVLNSDSDYLSLLKSVKNGRYPVACTGLSSVHKSAVISALCVSGLSTGRFAFEGFLSTNKNERSERLNEIKNDTRTTIFYEAPHKLQKTLEDLYGAFGDRRISLCRELTKLNEEILRMTLGDAVAYHEEHEPRGEYVLVIEGTTNAAEVGTFWQDMSIPAHVQYYVDAGMSQKDAIKAAARDRGVHKNEVYSAIVEQKNAQN